MGADAVAEIYFEGYRVPFGETFADALSCYEESAILGVHFGRGREQLDPLDYLLLEPDDQLILQHDELTKFYMYGPGVSGLLFEETAKIRQDSCVQGASLRVQLNLDENKIFMSGDQLILEAEGERIYLKADCFTGETYDNLPVLYQQLDFSEVHFQGNHNQVKRVVEAHNPFFALTKDHKKILVSTKNLVGKNVEQILRTLKNGEVKGVLCLRGTDVVNLPDDFTLDPDDEWIVNKNPLFIEAVELGNDFQDAVRSFADMSLKGIRLCNGCELNKPSEEALLQPTDKLILGKSTNGSGTEQCVLLYGDRWLGATFGQAFNDFENLTITGIQHANGDSEPSSYEVPFAPNTRLVINSPNSRIYIQGLSEKTFGEVCEIYQQAEVKGVRFLNGRTQLHPPMNTRLEKGDEIIAISEDDDTVKHSGKTQAEIDELIDRRIIIPTNDRQLVRKSEKTLILGWNHRAPDIICQLDEYVAPGSIVSVFAHIPDESLVLDLPLKNITPNCKCGDRTDADHLTKMKIISYDHVIVLSADNQTIQHADSRTLHTLLHLRHIASQSEHPPFILSEMRDSSNKELVDHMFSIVTEIRDGSNRQLAEVTQADDFIVSDKLVSLMLAQVSEERRLLDVFTELYRSRGSEVYLKPITEYIRIEENTETNFHTIVKAARQHGEVAIGYRLGAYMFSLEKNYGVVLNPNKSKRVIFRKKDKVIVMALDG